MSPSVRGRRPGPPALPAEEDEEVDLDGPAFVPPAKPIILPNTCVRPRHSRPLPWMGPRAHPCRRPCFCDRARPCLSPRGPPWSLLRAPWRGEACRTASEWARWRRPAKQVRALADASTPCTAHIAKATRSGAHMLTCLNCCTIHLCLPCTPVPCRTIPCLVSCPVLSGTCWATRVLTT